MKKESVLPEIVPANKEEIVYSIIIPHKNIPDLLRRCLDSIPQRPDIQIIVVDDNSCSDKVDFAHFPGREREGVEIVYTREGLGAGYARNVGLRHAKGRWLLFADADDYFCLISLRWRIDIKTRTWSLSCSGRKVRTRNLLNP